MLQIIPLIDETWLICGGRDFADDAMFDNAMRDLMHIRGGCPRKIVHGGAKGADTMAGEFGHRMSVACFAVLPDWQRGKMAGPLRNQKMLDEYKPNLVVAFPGGRGTADMVSRARKAGVDVAEIKRQG
jgi:hypothetical protein